MLPGAQSVAPALVPAPDVTSRSSAAACTCAERPRLREYRYVERENRTYIVEPGERRMIEEIDDRCEGSRRREAARRPHFSRDATAPIEMLSAAFC
jgi:hypothetical protein